MREFVIQYMKGHPWLIMKLWNISRYIFRVWSWFVPVQKKTVLFNSLGGRNFSDSPKAIYDEMLHREEFRDWRFIWTFVDPDKYEIPYGEKIKIDTYSFYKALLFSHVWVGNSRCDRGIGLSLDRNIRIETWHGTPLKKIGGEEHTETFAVKPEEYKGPIDSKTIRCAQSEYDRTIFARIFHATKESILLSDLPRNDELLLFSKEKLLEVKKSIGIEAEKIVVLYTPTYREYLIDENRDTFIAPPINLNKWQAKLGDKYVILIRAHYAVTAALGVSDNKFVKNVSTYPSINELYAISDMMISDYSSTYFDYSILNRPMFCFAYDLEEYEEKRGLYLDLKKILPCEVDRTEDDLLTHIVSLDYLNACEKTKAFHLKYAPYAGHASKIVVDELLKRLKNDD